MATGADPSEAFVARRARWTLGLTSAATFMAALDILAITTALDTIRRELDVGIGALEWTITSYNIAFAALIFTGSALGDRFGRRRMLVIGIVTFTAGSLGSALAANLPVLIAGRVVQGVGAALITPLALPLIAAAYAPDRRGRAFGVQAGVTGLATIAGPLVGGLVTGLVDWHWVFWLNVPVGIALVPLVLTKIPEQRGAATSLDLPGVLLATASLTLLSAALVRAAERGGQGLGVLLGIAGGVALAAAFVAWERRAEHPLLPVTLLTSRAVAVLNLGTVLHSVVVIGAVFVMAQYLQSGLGLTVTEAGVAVLPWTGTLLLAAPLAGRLADRFGGKVVAVGGLVLSAVGYASLAALVGAGDASYAELVIPLAIAGVGNSSVFPAIGALVASTSPGRTIGIAAGLNGAARELGAVLGVAVVAIAFAAAGSFADPVAASSGFAAAMLLCALVAAIAAATLALLPADERRAPPPDQVPAPAARTGTTSQQP
jgi:EmrB/QacA subfamily drug resistance transporter